MKIGIDARLVEETGVGRYIRNLLREIAHVDKKNKYILFGFERQFPLFQELLPQAKLVAVTSRWHSLAEQFELPRVYQAAKLDLLHVPYFTVPILYRGKYVVTIHDLTIKKFTTGKATTLPYPLYWLKKIAYEFTLQQAIARSVGIIAVSNTTKADILDYYPGSTNKIIVTYEGVDQAVSESKPASTSPEQFPYFLYVGNAYPHKNVETLLAAMAKVKSQHKERTDHLVLVGRDDFFYTRLKNKVHALGLDELVHFRHDVSDQLLAGYYRHARATVTASLAEGFALPTLEALQLDSHLIASDIPAFRELLPEFVQFIPPLDVDAWVEAMSQVSQQISWKSQSEKSQFFQGFSWQHMAEQTVALYESQ